MTDLALLCCFVMFVTLGCISPFVLSLGYVWVDALLPQQVSYGLLNSIPLSLILGAGAVFWYVLTDRRDPPRFSVVQGLCVILALWITLTGVWAVAPEMAWVKWDPSFKMVIFTAFIPYVFRSRVQIEAFVLVLVLSAAPHLLPWGAKTFLTGGGYGMALGLLGPNSAVIAESSTIAGIATMFVPLLAWIRQHSLILPWRKLTTLVTWAMSLLYLAATIGSFARTGLIAIFLLGVGMLVRSRRKVTFVMLAAVTGLAVFSATSDKWIARVDTIRDFNTEASANTRILVWKWTWEFAKSHPLGGGFNSFLVNKIVDKGSDGEEVVQFGRAFHNIYFAALGEHGYPGLALYLSIMIGTLLSQQAVLRRCKPFPELVWAADLARASQLSLVIMLACAMFVDISYAFVLWHLIALAMCLRAHVDRVTRPVKTSTITEARPDTKVSSAAPAFRRMVDL